MSTLKTLWEQHGQAVWLDYIQRSLVRDGELERLVADDGVRGVTSNPSIFEAAIAGSDDYDAAIDALLSATPDMSISSLYETLAISDIRQAADVLSGVFEASRGDDGYVSLEVSPHLAHDTAGTVAEARRLWDEVARPNLMIKVPATAAGISAIEKLISTGINVNATLMFSLAHYEAVAHAYLEGLKRCPTPATVASVASFFVSRVDTVVDQQLTEHQDPGAAQLLGKTAIANSKAAYKRFRELFHGPDFAPLKARGARAQRPLWASTSTKNPAYRDVVYIEELIGPETVNTVPTKTLDAFRDHGVPRASLTEQLDESAQLLARVQALGIDLDAITAKLQDDGVAAFSASFDSLMSTLTAKAASR